MGMFDYVKSSYPLGENFTDICQTKDIEDGIGGTMSTYWISPNGELYYIDYTKTTDFVELQPWDEGYDHRFGFLNFRHIPNGTHGKVTPCRLTKYVVIYPANWEGTWEDWPDVRLHFVDGKLQGFTPNENRTR